MQTTRVVVAHRPETIAMARRVVQMAGGRIVDDRRRDGPDGALPAA
jgi:ABC-type bacteriocin/lantibiotic exporter with double-glycine peptidase domain